MRFASRGRPDGGPVAVPHAAPRLYVLDGLRLLAALMVVVYHYTDLHGGWGRRPTEVFPHLTLVSRYGWLGVEVFFLISGFVICMSTWGRTLGDFIASRVSRIYPAYWFGVLLTGAVISLWPQVRHLKSWDTVFTNLTMLQQGVGVWDVDGVYWTLFIELKFYVLFALVVATGVTYRKCVMFCGLWTVAALTAQVTDDRMLNMWTMPLYAPHFIAGIAFYLMHRFKPTALLWGIAASSLLLSLHHMPKRVSDNTNSSVPVWPAVLILTLAYVVMALIAVGAFDRLQWRWLATAGALTYPLYLIHQYIGMTVIYGLRDRVPAPALVAGLIVVMLAAAWLINRWVEKPLSKRLRRAVLKGIEEMRRNSAPPAGRTVLQNGLTAVLQEPRHYRGTEPYEPYEPGGAPGRRLGEEAGRVAVGKPDGV
ncbi:acyltransferase family protein [Streptomyces sp. NPDC052396]|uniref:acyltransferase family protein n=1 Tax=Streptomyces sp. NPDC052396 TaxID=3365689 RepID=UPI0037CFB893